MILKAILFSMVVASVSFFISHSQLMEKPRALLHKYGSADKPWRSIAGKGARFFYELVTCPYCLGHWLTAVLLLVFPMRLFGIFAPVDYLFTWTVISWAAGLQSLAMSQLLGD